MLMKKEEGSTWPKLTEANRGLELCALDAALKNEKPGSLKIKVFALFAYVDLNKLLMNNTLSIKRREYYRGIHVETTGRINELVHKGNVEVNQAKLEAGRVFATYLHSRGMEGFNRDTINARPTEAYVYYKHRIKALRVFLDDIRKINKEKDRPAQNKRK